MWNMVANSAADSFEGSAKKLRENTSNARCLAASGKSDALQERRGVEVVEALVDPGHRHRGQRRGRAGVDLQEVAEPEGRAARGEGHRVPRRGARQPPEGVAPARPVDERIVVDGREHAQARVDARAAGPAGCSTAGRRRGSRDSSRGRPRRGARSSRRPGRRGSVRARSPRRRRRVRPARWRRSGPRCRRPRRPPGAATPARRRPAIRVPRAVFRVGDRCRSGRSLAARPPGTCARCWPPSRASFRCAPR